MLGGKTRGESVIRVKEYKRVVLLSGDISTLIDAFFRSTSVKISYFDAL